jgi:hypothetical protein
MIMVEVITMHLLSRMVNQFLEYGKVLYELCLEYVRALNLFSNFEYSDSFVVLRSY